MLWSIDSGTIGTEQTNASPQALDQQELFGRIQRETLFGDVRLILSTVGKSWRARASVGKTAEAFSCKDTFVEVGTALAEIRDSRIYRNTFKTFEEYCEKRWEMGKSHVNRMMDAAEVIGNLKTSPIGEVPKTESQARPLTKLPASEQPAAWERAQELAKEESKPVAARHVEAAVMVRQMAEKDGVTIKEFLRYAFKEGAQLLSGQKATA